MTPPVRDRTRPVAGILRSVLALSVALAATGGATARAHPAPLAAAHPFEAEIRAFEEADQRRAPPAHPVLFVGSSSFRMWSDPGTALPGFQVLNRGFGGSQLSDVLHFFDRIVTPYRPALVALYEGDNDLAAGKSVEVVFEEWLTFVARVEAALPGTGILFVAVKPSPSRAGVLDAQRELNGRIQAHAAEQDHLRFADVFTPMLDASGQPRPELFLADRLHLNAAGYALWASVIGPELEAWARDHPVPSIRTPARAIWFDFGPPEFPTPDPEDPLAPAWNLVGPDLAGTPAGTRANLVSTNRAATEVGFRVTRPFVGATTTGTTSATHLPASASRDALVAAVPDGSGFQLTGLHPGSEYRFTFHASTLDAGSPRVTRYSVFGANQGTADLDAAGNRDAVADISGLRPALDGTLRVDVRSVPAAGQTDPGGLVAALQVVWSPVPVPEILIDFGAGGSPTLFGNHDPDRHWNNVPASLAALDDGVLGPLVTADGSATAIHLRMVSRFNGANENGTGQSDLFPASATRDSLFGNTAAFSGLANVFPRFQLAGLETDRRYRLTFYASRLGVSDNRETRYTVTGAESVMTQLNAANNVAETATLTGLHPDTRGILEIALSPGPANNNANRFTYLGVLRVGWDVPGQGTGVRLSSPARSGDHFHLLLTGTAGRTYRIEHSTNLVTWTEVATVTLPSGEPHPLLFESPGTERFYRAVEFDGTGGSLASGRP